MSLFASPRFFCQRSRIRIAFWATRLSFHTASGDPLDPLTEPARQISTLKPAFLVPSDYLDLSGKKAVPISCHASQSEAALITYTKKFPFPKLTDGFLYYHRHGCAAPLEGAVRFRARAAKPPWTFIRGRDLLLPSGHPWEIILPEVACRAEYATIRNQLLAEKLVTEQQLSQCRDIFADQEINPETTLFRLTQEFPVSFTGSINLAVVGETLHHLEFEDMFRVTNDGKTYHPWTGFGLVCFEPTTGPGPRMVNLRIKQTIGPIRSPIKGGRFKGILPPRNGILLAHTRRGGLAPVKWAHDIDADPTPTGAALRLLWDNHLQLSGASNTTANV
ncbi:hypothetical protein B0H12DRAFT_518415 [Mycena haematopus]|nr:hypothetical protein B0H12DRAFT_518415 [Mycena haematopus]